jgi:hypothetical protein
VGEPPEELSLGIEFSEAKKKKRHTARGTQARARARPQLPPPSGATPPQPPLTAT